MEIALQNWHVCLNRICSKWTEHTLGPVGAWQTVKKHLLQRSFVCVFFCCKKRHSLQRSLAVAKFL